MDEKNKNNDENINPEDAGNTDNIPAQNTPSSIPPKKKRTFLQKTLRFSFYSFAIIFVLLLSIFFLVQTSYFKNWALHFVVDKMNAGLVDRDSKIYVGTIEGNIISGFKLHDVSVRVHKDTLVKVDVIDASFDLFGVLNKNIYISSFRLNAPQINFTRIRDKNDSLVWNYAYVLGPTIKDPADTLVKKFDWKITLDKFELIEANFRMLANRDENISVDKIPIAVSDTFNINNLYLKHLNLELAARYIEEYQTLDVKRINFQTNSSFDLRNLSFQAKINRNKDTKISNLSFSSDRTDFIIKTLYMDKLDPLERKVVYEDFRNNNIELEIKTDKFDFRDLIYFLPGINFLDGRVYLDLKTKGNYNNINIERLILKTDRSYYNLAGKVKGLVHPDSLYLDIVSNGSILDGGDTKDIIPGLHIPDYSCLGKVSADFHFVGYPLKFDADVNVRSTAGNISGKAYMDINPTPIYYRGDVKTSNLNLGRIFNDNTLESNINGSFNVNLYGTDYRKMRGKIVYEVSNTKFLKQNIQRSGGMVELNSGNANLDVNYTTNYIDSKILGKIGFSDLKNLSYDIKGNAGRFNIGGLSGDASQISNLNFTYDIKGSGTSLSSINGDIKIDFQPSVYGSYKIPLTTMTGYIHRSADSTDINLKSPFLDIRANGKYTFADLPSLISNNIAGIRQHLTTILNKDSVNNKNIPLNIVSGFHSESNASFGYDINIKDFTPIANVTGVEKLDFTARLIGKIVNEKNLFSVKLDTGVVRKFIYGDAADTSFYTRNSYLHGLLLNKTDSAGVNYYTGNLDLKALDVKVAGQKIDSLTFGVDGGRNDNKFTTTLVLDSNQRFYTTAQAHFYNDSTVFVFDSLGFKYKNYLLRDADSLVLAYVTLPNNNYLNFERFRVIENSQRINIEGMYSFNNSSDLTVSLNNIDLRKIQLRQNPDLEDDEAILGNLRRLSINYKGTMDDPQLHLEANSDVLRIANNRVGRLDALIDYKDNHIAPDISFYNENNEGRLLIKGLFPYANPLKDKDSLFISEFYKNEPVKINADAKNFQLKIIQQLIPLTSHLAGTLEGNINFGGIVSKPELSGLMKIRNGSLIVDMTKMFYNFDVDLNTEQQKVKIDNFRLFTNDNNGRFLHGNGYVDFTDIKVNDVDVVFDGDTKLFAKENGLTSLGIEGDLIGGSGVIPLRLKGNSNGLLLTGQLNLIDGNVTIDPEKKETEYSYNDDFRYILRIDSTAYSKDTISFIVHDLRDSLSSKKKKDLNPFETSFMAGKLDENTSPRENFFIYDVNLVNNNPIFVRFITNEKSRQEFFGDVNLNLFADNRNNGDVEARGRVTLGDNSYYKFYKNFRATGYLDFNGPLTNPELNIDGIFNTTRNKPNDASNSSQEVQINLKVTGKASDINLGWTVYVNGDLLNSSDPSADAITFIVFGKFQNELSASENLSIASSVGGVSANIGAVFVSNYFTNFIQQIIPFIVNTDINYVDSRTGSIAQNTDLRVTAQFGDAIVRVGGQIFDDISNTNIIIQYPLDKLLKLKAIQNKLILQLERTNDPLTTSNVTQSGVNEIRTGAIIFYKIKF